MITTTVASKGVIRSRKSKTEGQHNGQWKTGKKTNNDPQNTTPKKGKIGQHEGRRVNTDAPEVKTVTVNKTPWFN